MSNIAVVYMTKYGHTKQYADWLKEDLGADVFALGAFSPAQTLSYKLIIFLSGVYNDKIQIMDFIKKNQTAFNIQRMMIGAVSWYTNESEEAKAKLIAENFPENYKNVVPLFVINSGIDKKKINAMEKAQLLAAQMSISKHDERSSDDINALAIIKGYSDQTSRDNLAALKKAVDLHFNPPKEQPKPKEPPKAEAVKPAPAPETKPAPAAEKAPEPETLKPLDTSNSAPKESGGVVVSSLDDALAALNSGNAFAKNAAPVRYSASVEKPETNKEEELAVLDPVKVTAPVAEPAPMEEIKPAEEKAPEPPKDDLLASLDNAFAHLGAKKPETAPVEEIKPAEEKAPEPPKDDLLASLDNAFAHLGAKKPEPIPAPVEEKPVKPTVKPEPKLQPEDDPHILKGEPTQEEKDKLNALDSLESAFANLKKPEPKPHEIRHLNVPPIHSSAPAEPAPKEEPAPEPTIIPKPVAPKKNSYLELFSKRTKTEEAVAAAEQSAKQAAPEPPKPEPPKPDPIPEPVKPAAPEPVAFDPFFDNITDEPVQAPEPARYTAPVSEEPVSSSIDDFDFDLMGNESSTASKSSKRVLTAVSDLAKAKAAAEAEKAKKEAENNGEYIPENTNTYSAADEQPSAAVPEASYEPEDKPVHESEPQSEETYDRHHENTAEAAEEITKALREVEKYISKPEAEPEPKYEPEPEAPEVTDFGADDIIFDNSRSYEPEENIEVEEVPSGGRFDFKKLQQEIEASIEVNKKIKEKERLRNTRELDRAKKEEDEAPKKGIKQPIDPDIFFQRPGKDYYDSDTMPEIRFDRHRRG